MRLPKGGIGFFDSGIGGLTVMEECRKVLPDEIFYYYGDNKRAPYGNLPQEKIRKYVLSAFKRFQHLGVCAVVVACNTATAVCIDELRARFSYPIIGIEPALLCAAKNGGKIFVLMTKATFESERFARLQNNVRKEYPSSDISCYPCFALAGEIERNINNPTWNVAPFLPQGSPDTVVLGCTHYKYAKEQIERFYGCKTIDGNEGIAKRLKAILGAKKEVKNTLQPPDATARPQSEKNRGFLPLKTTSIHLKDEKKSRNEKTNECSRLKQANLFNQKGCRVFFMGSGRQKNRKIWKQMFVFCLKK